jgi:hypothetical protein
MPTLRNEVTGIEEEAIRGISANYTGVWGETTGPASGVYGSSKSVMAFLVKASLLRVSKVVLPMGEGLKVGARTARAFSGTVPTVLVFGVSTKVEGPE